MTYNNFDAIHEHWRTEYAELIGSYDKLMFDFEILKVKVKMLETENQILTANNFYNSTAFCYFNPTVKDLAVKLENMLVRLDHHLLISEDGLYCKIFYYEPSPNAYPGVYKTQKVFEMLNSFNKHKNYLWSFLQNCKP